MDELRSWFEVPAIAHYFHIFRRSFELIDFEIEDFEETLFLDSAENVSTFLPDLVIRLLRGLYKTKDGLNVTLENYNYYLRDLLSHHYVTLQNKQNPVADCEFKALDTRTKVQILYDMCNWRLELLDAMELTKDLDADEMRIEPLGRDNHGNTYWYFYGTRLYKEGFSVNNEEAMVSDHSESEVDKKAKTTKRQKRKKRVFSRTKSGRSVRKKRKMDESSQESGNDSERSVEIPDVDTEDSNLSKPDTKSLKLNLSVNAWSLACSTLEQWEELCNKFKGAKTKNEKDLRKRLCALYEDMPELFSEREKALQRKLIAMMPRRVSDRITIKMKQREDEERRLEQERLLKSQQKVKDAEERQKHQEKEKEKKREQRYKERERIQEERALRAKLRETQKLVADNPELANEIEPVAVGLKNKIQKTHSKDDEDEDYEDEDIHAAMKRIMEVLNNDDDAWPFLEPVKEEEAPHYYEYIKNPMDFKTIGEKIENKEYKTKDEFENDINLVFDNCETYNGTHSSFTKLAFIVKKVFDKLMKREFPPVLDVDEDDDDFFEVDDFTGKSSKPKKVKQSKQDSPFFTAADSPGQSVASKKVPIVSRVAGNTVHAQTLHAQVRMKQIHQNAAMLHTSPRAALAAAANILPARFGISPETIAKMSPAQMQALVLGYPRIIASSVTAAAAAQANASQSVTPNTTITNTVSNTTFLTPLQQLADTALAPSTCSIRKLISEPKFITSGTEASTGAVTPKAVVSATLPSTPYYIVKSDGSMTLTQGVKRSSQNIRLPLVNAARASNRGRPKKIVIPPKKSLLVLTNNKNTQQATPVPGGYVSGYNSAGSPITVKWEDLKKQLMSQMQTDTQIALDLSSSQTGSNALKGSAISTMPVLRPVGAAKLGLQLTASTPSTAHSDVKMFSFSNMLKTSVPTENKSDAAKQTTSVVSSVDNRSNITPQSNESKVQNWLNSSQPFIEKAITAVHTTRSSSSLTFSSPIMASPSAILMTGKKLPVNRNTIAPQTLRSVIATKLSPVVSISQLNRVTISSTAPPSKQSLAELQKAARQAAVVNQLSTKLQTHLSDGSTMLSSSKVDVPSVKVNCITSCQMTPSQSSLKSPSKIDGVLSSPVNLNLPVNLPATPTTSHKSIAPTCLASQLKFQQPGLSSTTLTSHVDSKTFSLPISRILPNGKQSPLQLTKLTSVSQKIESSIPATNKALPYVIKCVVPQTSPNIPQSLAKLTGVAASTSVVTQPAIRFLQIPESALSAQSLIVQQKVNKQTIRYVIPSQSTIVGNSVLDLSQLGGMQNLIVNNSTVPLGNPPSSPANVQFVLNSNLNGNVKILSTQQMLTKQPSSPLSTISVTPITPKPKEITSSVNMARNGIATNGEASHAESTIKKHTPVLQNPLPSGAKLQNFSQPIQHGVASAESSPANSLSISVGTVSPVVGSNKPSVVSYVKATSVTSANAIHSSTIQQAVVTQKSLSVTPAQLQKLKDEGRILMTSSGQLVMIPTSSLNAHVK